MAFHWKGGWYFERLKRGHQVKTGTVRVYHIPPGEQIADVDIEIDPDSWASIVASVCQKGETADTFRRALTFHDTGKCE